MEFGLLGPLEVWDEGAPIEVRGSKRRAVLALLLLHANEVVRSERLIDELWGERPPANASAALHNHVSRLRKDLGPELLATKPWGYVLRAEPEAVDLQRFETLLVEAKPLPAQERREKLGAALALWRGPALADVRQEPGLAVEAEHLDERRLAALEQRIDADLELGEHEELVPQLETLVGEHPLRERLRGQLILALYRSGRQAEALETYRETRRVLVEELGIEPGAELRELERAILCQDPALASITAPAPEALESDRTSRWRWPRSPLVLGAVLLLLGGTATAAVVLATKGSEALQPESAPAAISVPQFVPAKLVADPGGRPGSVTGSTAGKHSGHKNSGTKPLSHSSSHKSWTGSLVSHSAAPANKSSSSSGQAAPLRPSTPGAGTDKPSNLPPKLVRISDAFGGNTINPRVWTYAILGTGVEIAQRDGQLVATFHDDAAPDAKWNAMSAGYETACSFTGNFDARIDYTMLDWPQVNGAVIGFDLAFPDNVVNIVRASRVSGFEEYAFWAPSGEWRSLLTTDIRGRFRMRRVGDLITSYIWNDDQEWAPFESAHRAGPVRLRPLLWASGSDFAHMQVSVAFDNFSVLAPRSGCA